MALSAKQPKSWHPSADLPTPVMEADDVRAYASGQMPAPKQ